MSVRGLGALLSSSVAALLLSSLGPLLAAGVAPDPDGRPNVLFFMVDDLGWQDTSLALHASRTPFNERYHTPNMERLAARGVAFTQAYASAPVCTPTRTSLMTGRSPARNKITYWTLWSGQDTSAAYEGLLPPAWNTDGLQPGDVTLPALLSAAGWRTIHVGKSHLGAKGSPGDDPTTLGFDINVAGHGAGAPASYLGSEDFARDGVWDVPGLQRWHGRDVFLTEALAVEAADAVRAAVAEDRRFFLHLASYAVHAPITANRELLGRYPELPEREAAYATMVESVDDALGAMLDLLDELQLSERTLVVLASDNGGLSAHGRDGEPHTHNRPLRSGKGSAYEGGLRVPLVIAWPGVIPAGTRCEVPVVTHDLFSTLLSACAVPVPAAHAATVEGRDLLPCLRGEPGAEAELAARDLFWHQPHYWGISGPGIWPFSAVRRGDWKLIYRHRERACELYDLASDLGEEHDLSGALSDQVAELAEVLSAWLEEVDADMSIDSATGMPVPLPRQAPLAPAEAR